MDDKIQPHHRRRTAYIYVRQSTGPQVRYNHQGRQRQYDLAGRAEELGFARVRVIDDDQGKTGSGLVERPGFQALLAAVCGGEAGAVFALEASRLARNNRDWHHLIDLCSLTETLIVDADGIYDPRQVNDRLLLGLKGTMSEFELTLFRQRAREAFEMKVARGHAMWEMPAGLVRTADDRVEMTPDRQVQAAIRGLFKKFRQLGSARQAALWYRDEKVPLPEVVPGTRGREVTWRAPTYSRVRQVLKNPAYAGALAYGRTAAKTEPGADRPRRSPTRTRKPRPQWKVLILDNHPGYISWDEYLENQAVLETNAAGREGTGKGAAKGGAALLAGLLRCGNCGRKLFVAYGGNGGRTQRYNCHGGRENRGSAACQSFSGKRVEQAVAGAVLEAVQPAGVQAALDALAHADQRRDEKAKSLELALEKARYEAGLARRQYGAVDPDNRLVAAELEARWNAALGRVAELEQQCQDHAGQSHELTGADRDNLLALGRDLPALWEDPEAPAELKKRILRTVVEEVVVRDGEQRLDHLVTIHWKGGVHTALNAPRNTTGKRFETTDKTALELIEELSKVCADHAIAATLNRLGFKTGGGKTWRVHSVRNTRYYHRLKNHRNTGRCLTVEQAAKELQVSHTVVRRLIREGVLPAAQVAATTPWIIERTALSLPAVQTAAAHVKSGRQPVRDDPSQQVFPLE